MHLFRVFPVEVKRTKISNKTRIKKTGRVRILETLLSRRAQTTGIVSTQPRLKLNDRQKKQPGRGDKFRPQPK